MTCLVTNFSAARIVLLIRFWHPQLPADRWRETLDAGMADFAAMLRRRVSPPANARVADAGRPKKIVFNIEYIEMIFFWELSSGFQKRVGDMMWDEGIFVEYHGIWLIYG